MKILVIGSKGFIGSHCLKYFQKDHDVWGCDVFTDHNEPNFFLVSGFNSDFAGIFSKMQFDCCINCSGAASVPDSLLHPGQDYELNVYNVARILDAIRKYSPTCKFINLSSAAVYGNPETLPVQESSQIRPVSPYGIHKSMAEKLCEEFYTFFGIATCSLRIFSAFGDGLRKQLFWDVYRKSKLSDTIELFGTGNESRDYIYIDDIVNAIELVMQKSPFQSSVYNIGRGEAWTIRNVSELLVKELRWKGTLVFSGHHRAGDPEQWEADIAAIRKLGFELSVSVEEGINKYASWLLSLD